MTIQFIAHGTTGEVAVYSNGSLAIGSDGKWRHPDAMPKGLLKLEIPMNEQSKGCSCHCHDGIAWKSHEGCHQPVSQEQGCSCPIPERPYCEHAIARGELLSVSQENDWEREWDERFGTGKRVAGPNGWEYSRTHENHKAFIREKLAERGKEAYELGSELCRKYQFEWIEKAEKETRTTLVKELGTWAEEAKCDPGDIVTGWVVSHSDLAARIEALKEPRV